MSIAVTASAHIRTPEAPAPTRAPLAVAGPVRTRLRMTRRGRRALAGLIALPIAAVIGWGAVSGGAAIASHESGAPAGSFRVETAYVGDSLWSIAQRVAPHADPRDVVAEIMRLNALESSQLTPGQEIAIPAGYEG